MPRRSDNSNVTWKRDWASRLGLLGSLVFARGSERELVDRAAAEGARPVSASDLFKNAGA
jgi:hypothetical protein